jgi:hypothetical protein
MKNVSAPQQEKHRFLSAKQVTLRKDVECDFGLLKKRFNILAIPDRSYSQHTLGMKTGHHHHRLVATSYEDEGGVDLEELSGVNKPVILLQQVGVKHRYSSHHTECRCKHDAAIPKREDIA